MNWQSFPTGADAADAHSVDQVSFDILRALLASRQATSPTVRALAMAERHKDDTGAAVVGVAGRVALLNGRGSPPDGAHGPFFSACPSNRLVDGPVARKGERHV